MPVPGFLPDLALSSGPMHGKAAGVLEALGVNASALWRADALADAQGAVWPSGHAALDAQLPGGGWPAGGLTELLQAPGQYHEWRLLMPALARQLAPGGGPVVLVNPPHVPLVPALAAQGLPAQRLLLVRADTPAAAAWACEQALRCAQVVAVLAWLPQTRPEVLRRLHLAAQSHSHPLFVLRPACAGAQASPAVLRLLLSLAPAQGETLPDELQVHLLKRRGPSLAQPLLLPARPARLLALLAASRQAGAQRRSPPRPATLAPAQTPVTGHALARPVFAVH